MKKFLEDLDVYAFRLGLPKWSAIFMIFLCPATWAIGIYRFGNWVYNKCKMPFIRQIFFILYFILKRLSEILTGIEIAHNAEIGKGLFIGHLSGITIGHGSKIGNYSSFHQGVTIGGAGRREKYGYPTIGNSVYIGAGAKIIGKIDVGNNVIIGANAVVESVSDNAVVVWIPAKLISHEGSMDLCILDQKIQTQFQNLVINAKLKITRFLNWLQIVEHPLFIDVKRC
jgi:serine O-acetyltransferase